MREKRGKYDVYVRTQSGREGTDYVYSWGCESRQSKQEVKPPRSLPGLSEMR